MSRVFVHLTYLCCIFIFGISSLNWNEVKVTQFCLTLCSPMDYTVLGILQARILEWVAFPFSRGSSQPRDRIQVSCIAGGFFTSWAIREYLIWSFRKIDSKYFSWLFRPFWFKLMISLFGVSPFYYLFLSVYFTEAPLLWLFKAFVR